MTAAQPTPVAQLVSAPAVRSATCACGATFEQVRQPWGTNVWAPGRCEACQAQVRAFRAPPPIETPAERRATRLEALGVPPLYAHATLDSFRFHGPPPEQAKQRKVLALARAYVSAWPERAAGAFPVIAVFAGEPGTGKGHVAWSIAKAVCERDGSVIVEVLSDTIRHLREAWRDNAGPSELARLERYRTTDLLVLDEVSEHALFGVEHAKRHLYDVVAHREQYLRPTILTTNEDVASLARLLGPALVSRAEGWGGVWDFGRADYRPHRRGGR